MLQKRELLHAPAFAFCRESSKPRQSFAERTCHLAQGHREKGSQISVHHTYRSIIHNSQKVEVTKVSTDGQMGKINVVSPYNGV